jgi:5S rRNA maturation endonuclease (ribonuclease M5)
VNEELQSSRIRLEALEELLSALLELNKRIPVIVEGKRDVLALRALGFEGELLQVHSGKGLYEFSEEVHERFKEVILLLDWDQRGEVLYESLGELLSGLWERYSSFRETLKILSRNEVFEIESIPDLMERLRSQCELQE